jgi:hypothetical protein
MKILIFIILFNVLNYTGGGRGPFEFTTGLKGDGIAAYADFNPYSFNTSNFCFSYWKKTNGAYDINGEIGKTAYTQTTSNRFFFNYSGYSIQYRNWLFSVFSGIYNIFFTCENGNARVFVNGVESTTGTQFINNNANGVFNYLFLRQLSNGTQYLGSNILSNIAIWPTSGTPQNAIDLFNGGLGNYPDEVKPNPDIYWQLNGTGTQSNFLNSGVLGSTYNLNLNNFQYNASSGWVDL